MTYTTSTTSRAHGIVTLVIVGTWLVIGAAVVSPFLPALVAVMK